MPSKGKPGGADIRGRAGALKASPGKSPALLLSWEAAFCQ